MTIDSKRSKKVRKSNFSRLPRAKTARTTRATSNVASQRMKYFTSWFTPSCTEQTHLAVELCCSFYQSCISLFGCTKQWNHFKTSQLHLTTRSVVCTVSLAKCSNRCGTAALALTSFRLFIINMTHFVSLNQVFYSVFLSYRMSSSVMISKKN